MNSQHPSLEGKQQLIVKHLFQTCKQRGWNHGCLLGVNEKHWPSLCHLAIIPAAECIDERKVKKIHKWQCDYNQTKAVAYNVTAGNKRANLPAFCQSAFAPQSPEICFIYYIFYFCTPIYVWFIDVQSYGQRVWQFSVNCRTHTESSMYFESIR